MFGLMKNTGCLKAGQPDWYRLHYCGTCKSIGRLYGQRSRMLLNFDSVFLAEILSVIQEADTEQWDEKLYAHNCFSMPEAEALPTSLQYAADMNLILVELKVRDNAQDDVQFVWKMAQRFLKKPLARVQDRMAVWNIDPQVLLEHQAADAHRETLAPTTDNPQALLDWHAAPSAAITGYLFAKGVEAIERPAWRDTVYELGYAFGELIYGLDAWKDIEKDELEAAFNPLLIHPSIPLETQKQAASDWLWEKAKAIEGMIQQAPVAADIKASLISRLMLNLAATLGESPHVCTPQSGIEKATVPTIARTVGRIQQHIGAWTDPLRPARFAASYIALLFVIFHQQLFAAAEYGAGSGFTLDYAMIGALIGAPIGMYLLAKGISKNRERLLRKLDRQQRRMKRRLQRAERKARKKDGGLKWWAWALIGVVGVLTLATLIAISSGGGGGGSCGGGGGCGDCGDCCGDCGCDPNCNC